MPADPQQVQWFVRNLRHTKGKWAGKPFDVLPWQDDLLTSLASTWHLAGRCDRHYIRPTACLRTVSS